MSSHTARGAPPFAATPPADRTIPPRRPALPSRRPPSSASREPRVRRQESALMSAAIRLASGCVLALALTAAAAAQAPTPDQQAEMALAAGRKAYNDGNPPFAAEKFREFLQKFGGHKDAQA